MRRFGSILAGIAVLLYALYGYVEHEIYIPGRYTSGHYAHGGQVLWVVLSYVSLAVSLFIWALPSRKIVVSNDLIRENPRAAYMEMRTQMLLIPKYVGIAFFLCLAILLLFVSLAF